MRREPIEIGWASQTRNGSKRKRRQPVLQSLSATAKQDGSATIDAIDEAFAGYTRANTRVTRIDLPDDHASRAATRALVAKLSAQLEALDDQRQQLVRLLDNIEPATQPG